MLRFLMPFIIVPVLFLASLSPSHAAPPAPSPTTPALVAAATKEGMVTFYTSIDLQVVENLAKAFQDKYPGITVVATWCFIFIGTIRELSAAIMLTTANTKLVSILIYDLNESGDLGLISVLGLTLLIVTFVVVACVSRVPGLRQGGARSVRNY